jgi:hypothetical protein
MTRHTIRPLRVLVAAGITLVVVGLAVPVSAAVAAQDDSPVTVTVPTATPTSTPSPSPTPSQTPPAPEETRTDTPPSRSSSSTSSRGSGTSQPADQSPAAAAPTEPRIAKTPSTTAEQATVDKKTYGAGDALTVTFAGFTAKEKVQVVLYSEPILIGNVDAGDDGVVTHSFQIPADLPPGVHTVQLTGWESGKIATASIVVAAAPSSAAPDVQGVPLWAWWVGGGIVAALIVAGGWWLFRTMRDQPGEATA